MDHSRYSKFKSGALLLAILTLSACSSSPTDDPDAPPPDTIGDASAPDASTDAVPNTDPSAPAADPSVASADAPPADSTIDPGSAPPPAVTESAPVADASTPAAASLDAPPPPVAAAPAPVADAPAVVDTTSAPAPVADTTPPAATTAAADTSAPTSGDAVHYKVKHGDTLMKIAFENYGDLYRWKEIYEANRAQISDPNHVPPGTQITLNNSGMVTVERNGEQYLIKHGDTLGLISSDVYGTPRKWKKLWENNRQLIKDPNKIYAGFYLYYQPEARLTHDENTAPEQAEDGGSAANTPQNLPFKNQPAAPVTTAQNTVNTAPAQTVQATTPATPGTPENRAPASK